MLEAMLPAVPALYALMFEPDHAWAYTVETTAIDDHDRRATTTRTMTCKVGEVAVRGAATVARITCDGAVDPGVHVDGIWAATAAGLNRIGDATDALPATEDAATNAFVVIAAKPKVARVKTRTEFDGYALATVTHPNASTWCATDDQTHTGGGPGTLVTLCFAGGGLASGTLDWRDRPRRVVAFRLANRR
jgi:hypothetical protein